MLISLLICLLVSNAVTLRRDKSILFSRVVIKSLLFCSFLAFNNLFTKPLEKGIGIYGGLFNITTFTQTFNIFIFLISATILVLTAFYPRKVFIKEHSSLYKLLTSKFTYNKNTISNKTSEQFRIIEYALITVFILCGAVFLISTGDLISVFLSIELQSYGLYILSTLYRDSESATASGLTYFLLGGLSSCFILLGSALLYVNSGTTNLDNIYVISSISEIENLPALTYWYQPHYLHLSLIILFVGFLFKVSAAPFHFWSPDVYDGIPTIVTTYVAIISKISIFAFFLELVFYTEYSYLNFTWKSILLLSSLFSLIIGSVLGLTQFRIKRLFAYSTISHVGFILLALSINKAESIQAYIFYILQYSLSNLNAFIILVTIGFSLYLYVYKEKEYKNLVDVNNSPIQLINQIKGYFYINPYLAISLAITLFSFVGVPPLMGFFAKQMVLSAALDNGYVFMTLVAILTSVIGAGYYLNLIKQIFFFKDNYKINPSISNLNLVGYISPAHFVTKRENNSSNTETSASTESVSVRFNPNNITINSALSSTISILTLLLILFIYIPGEWFNIVSILTLILFKA
jgi:NADH-ubiquinone oxidoreductase chain 2